MTSEGARGVWTTPGEVWPDRTSGAPSDDLDCFLSDHWGHAPGMLRSIVTRPLCSAADMLQIVRGLSRNISVQSEPGARFFVDGLQVPQQHPLEQAFVVDEATTTLADYVETVSRRLAGRPFCVVIDDAALLNNDVWQRMQEFAARIIRQTGYPTGRIEYNAFISTCEFTPFGVHYDRSHTFTVLAGSDSKTMVTWPRSALTGAHGGSRVTKDHARIAKLAENGTSWCLTTPTDVLYVPPGWWHVSRKRENCPFQASVALGFALERTPAADLSDLVGRELQRALEPLLARLELDPQRADHATTDHRLNADTALSRQNAIALDRAQQLFRDGVIMNAVESALRLRTLHRLSGLVESTRTRQLEPIFPPPRTGCPITRASRVRLLAQPFYADIAGHRIIALNGGSFVPTSQIELLLDVIRRLEGGSTFSVCELNDGDAEVRRFLEFAWSVRALAVLS